MIAAVVLVIYAVIVALTFREITSPEPKREARVIVAISVLVASAVICGGIAGGTM